MSRPCTLDTFGILMSIGALVALNCGAAETNAPTQATDAFVLEQERIHKDILFEKVFIPPDGVSAYVICMRAKANDIKPAVIVLHGGEAGTADKTQTIPGCGRSSLLGWATSSCALMHGDAANIPESGSCVR